MTGTNGSSSYKNEDVTNPFVPPLVPGYPTQLPQQAQPIGSLLSPDEGFKQNINPPKLFEPLTIRDVTFPNRAWVAPMCMYSSDDGKPTDHHFVHLGSMAMRGWGSIMIEATAVLPEGRISRDDSGLWSDDQIPGFKRIVDYVHALKGKIGIQLAHAGRKAGTQPPWVAMAATGKGWTGGSIMKKEEGGWPDQIMGPSPVSFHDGKYGVPEEMSLTYIADLKQAWLDAVERCKHIGFDFIEIHGAHGYLIHEFLSPVSNRRKDQYGGSLDNRLRLALETAQIVRQAWDKPLFFRFSASDWLEADMGPAKASPGQAEEYAWWDIEQTTILSQKLAEIGVDVLDVSSGGNSPKQKIEIKPGYQVPFAAHLKKHVKNIIIGAVGIITDPHQAEDILQNDEADVVFMARQVLRDIDFPLKAALELGAAVNPSLQYERAWTRMVVKREHTEANGVKAHSSEVEGEEGKKEKIHHRSRAPPEVHQSIP